MYLLLLLSYDNYTACHCTLLLCDAIIATVTYMIVLNLILVIHYHNCTALRTHCCYDK
jgi:hypothetical protein